MGQKKPNTLESKLLTDYTLTGSYANIGPSITIIEAGWYDIYSYVTYQYATSNNSSVANFKLAVNSTTQGNYFESQITSGVMNTLTLRWTIVQIDTLFLAKNDILTIQGSDSPQHAVCVNTSTRIKAIRRG